MLLHNSTTPRSKYIKSLTLHLINASKMCIPALWNTTDPPTLVDWFKPIDRIADMEELIHQSRDTPIKFQKTWNCCSHYQTSTDYTYLMAQ